jgi:hypothetical protein
MSRPRQLNRFRPKSAHKQTHAPQQFAKLFDQLIGLGRQRGQRNRAPWDEKGAILSEIAQASRRQYDPAIGRLSDMPKFCTLAGEFNSCSARQSATIRRQQR